MNSEKQSTNLQMTLREVNRVGERQKNVPKIRFKGYEDAWEQRKLGDLCERVVRKNKNFESDLPLTIASQYGLIDQRNFFGKVVAAKDMSNYYLLKKGEFAYNKSYSKGFDFGSIKRLNNYEQGCLSTLYICFKISSNRVESDYLEVYFDTLNWYKDVMSICAEGARNHGLLNVDTKAFFEEVNVDTPQGILEQKNIALFLEKVDQLITLHQRKYDALKSMKKTLLSKMFPKNGEDVPEIRFKGFTDAWEQRKLGQVLDFSLKTNSLSRSMLNYEEGELKNIHYGDILMDYCPILNFKTDTIPYITEGKVEEFTSQLLMNGDVVFADAAEDESVGKAIEINGLEEQCLVSGLHTIVGRPTIKFAERFLGYYINSNSYHNQLLPLMQGTKVSSISKTTLQKTMIIYPKVNSEQLKIGSFFYCLESIITLHQRKLDELKNMKKTLLQQMFV